MRCSVEKFKKIIVVIVIAVIVLNSYLLFTNFRLNRQAAAISYTKSDHNRSEYQLYDSNIKNLKKILEEPEQESISLIDVINVSGTRMSFEARTKNLDEIERLHILLSKIYSSKKITVNITKEEDDYRVLFEYIDKY